MTGYINRSGLYEMEEFGVVQISVRRDARSIKARWKGERLHISAPSGIAADRLLEALRNFGDRLEQHRPEQKYTLGQSWHFPHFSITLGSQNIRPRSVSIDHDGNHNYTLGIHSDIDLSSPSGCEVVSRSICNVAQRYGQRLLQRAREIAEIVGCKPLAWEISRGRRTLGHCNTHGVIALSYILLLYPQELADSIICHELAHLGEMNHSAAFHALCDAYCRRVLGKSEASLHAALRHHTLPIIK